MRISYDDLVAAEKNLSIQLTLVRGERQRCDADRERAIRREANQRGYHVRVSPVAGYELRPKPETLTISPWELHANSIDDILPAIERAEAQYQAYQSRVSYPRHPAPPVVPVSNGHVAEGNI